MDYNPRQPAAVACMSCRRLKMRCVGGGSPPCRRCLKHNRECVVRLPNRNQRRPSSSQIQDYRNTQHALASPVSSSSHASVSRQLYDRSPSETGREYSINQEPLGLPSIFSSSPLSIAAKSVPERNDSFDDHASIPSADADHISPPVIRDLVEL
ncbi:hypothetical protein BJX68DRAFT_233065 [Aspergillus pseudodeflectus]|uniref:Zn(2)-C6 fungal-type domain-containing protein n=1 Tax=Aspergillus pseudodeflectus TaxID=176178 RepID=A0ABR4KQM0_9EURO